MPVAWELRCTFVARHRMTMTMTMTLVVFDANPCWPLYMPIDGLNLSTTLDCRESFSLLVAAINFVVASIYFCLFVVKSLWDLDLFFVTIRQENQKRKKQQYERDDGSNDTDCVFDADDDLASCLGASISKRGTSRVGTTTSRIASSATTHRGTYHEMVFLCLVSCCFDPFSSICGADFSYSRLCNRIKKNSIDSSKIRSPGHAYP
jgi:hypothetical protein